MSEGKKEIDVMEKIFSWVKFLKVRSTPKKDVTPFVKRQREIDALGQPRVLWNSQTQGTYMRSRDGELI